MQDQDDQLTPPEFFKSFDLKEAWNEAKDEFQFGTVKSKASSGAKLLGKSLWNAGLSIAKNLPEHLEKAKASIEKQNEDREKKKQVFERKSNGELYNTAKNGGDDAERRMAFDILKARKAEHDAKQSQV
ncbi:hypothetical protein [Stutzerimonas nitrititolerans]|uniref:hypothetical protein n=1 Tax=Stutzerimonas nitrititolerans TaxID=2482751 RepID=UPI00289D9CB3|nr:hypothetical protein [Stutzerimonas nitrititolerans]